MRQNRLHQPNLDCPIGIIHSTGWHGGDIAKCGLAFHIDSLSEAHVEVAAKMTVSQPLQTPS